MFENVKIKIMKGYLFFGVPGVWYLPEDEKWLDEQKGGLHESAYRGRTPDTGGS